MHSGSANCGHYTAYVKLGNQWYYCNDEKIVPINEDEVIKLAERGYGVNNNTLPTTLVYERTKTRAHYPEVRIIQPKQPSVESRPPYKNPPRAKRGVTPKKTGRKNK